MYNCINREVYHARNKKHARTWCSTKEMCEYLGVSRDTLLTWINEKKMPASKVGRSWKFKISEVDEWIKSGKAAD